MMFLKSPNLRTIHMGGGGDFRQTRLSILTLLILIRNMISYTILISDTRFEAKLLICIITKSVLLKATVTRIILRFGIFNNAIIHIQGG